MSITSGEKPSGTILRHLVGLILFLVIGFAVAAIWIFVLTKIFNIDRGGFGLGAGVVVFPVMASIYGLFLWLPVWIIHNRRWGEMSSMRAILIGLVTGFFIAMVMAGLRGFTLAGGSELFGWATIAVTTIGAWSHNKILNP
ncbi:MAG: hypothetical protein JKY32_08710 [Rhizobiales bacterium]|nr:hypothetical protein [Hyphomicrobiales bacterium]